MNTPEHSQPDGLPIFRRGRLFLLCFAITVVMLASLGFFFHGKPGIEKTLTRLTFPVGFCWLILTSITLLEFIQPASHADVSAGLSRSGGNLSRKKYFLLNYCRAFRWLCVWILFTATTTSFLPDACLHYTESSVEAFNPARDPPLDVLVVLGGGTGQGPHRAQVSEGGDRVVYAAELLVQGYAKRLVTTGKSLSGNSLRTDPSQQTKEIWLALGIPENAIQQLPGINTFDEFLNIQQAFSDEAGIRLGVLTSAWHLPRAMRLARNRGLSFIPVAADYRAPTEPRTFMDHLPSAENLDNLAMIQHEWMARLVNR